MKLEKPIPILRMFDEALTKAFYVDFLGFKIDWEHRFEGNFPLYMQVSHGECVLHLTGHFGDASGGGAIRIAVDDIDTYQQGLLAKQYKHARPGAAQLMPWGSRDLTITDPSGNKITFMQPPPGAAS